MKKALFTVLLMLLVLLFVACDKKETVSEPVEEAITEQVSVQENKIDDTDTENTLAPDRKSVV